MLFVCTFIIDIRTSRIPIVDINCISMPALKGKWKPAGDVV